MNATIIQRSLVFRQNTDMAKRLETMKSEQKRNSSAACTICNSIQRNLGESSKSKLYVGLTPLVGNGADKIHLLFLSLFISLKASVSYWLSHVKETQRVRMHDAYSVPFPTSPQHVLHVEVHERPNPFWNVVGPMASYQQRRNIFANVLI